MKWLRLAARNVLRNRRRSLVTVLIAAVGTCGILVGGGFALYTYESLATAAARDSGHLLLAHPDYFEGDEETPMQHGLASYGDLQARLREDARVSLVLPRLHFSGLVSNDDKSAVFVGIGVEPDGEFRGKGATFKLVAGDFLADGKAPEILLGTELAREMKASPGSGLTLLSTTTAGSLNAVDVRVRGIVTTGVPEIDKRLVYTGLDATQQLLLTDKVSTLSVYLHETGLTDAMKESVATAFPGLGLRTWRDQAFYYNAVRSLYNRIFGLLGMIVLVMVLFAVTNTLAMAVLERTREIGTLRALGTHPGQIVRIFALEGLVLGASGGVAGMLAALGISLFVRVAGFQMPPPPGRSVGYPLLVNISPELYVQTLLAIVALAITAAWAVSRKAAAKPIVEALSHV